MGQPPLAADRQCPEVSRAELVGLWRSIDASSSDREALQSVMCETGRLGGPGLRLLMQTIREASEPDNIRNLVWAMARVPLRLWRGNPSEHADAVRLTIALLTDASDVVVAEAVDALADLQGAIPTTAVDPLRQHWSPYVRGSVLRYLRRTQGNGARDDLVLALSDPHYIVREGAIDELEELEAMDLIPTIGEFLHDPHPDVREAAKGAIERLRYLGTDDP